MCSVTKEMNYQHFLHAFMGQALDGGGQWWLEPFGRTNSFDKKEVGAQPVRNYCAPFLGQTDVCFIWRGYGSPFRPGSWAIRAH
jgi:hypothetical protein